MVASNQGLAAALDAARQKKQTTTPIVEPSSTTKKWNKKRKLDITSFGSTEELGEPELHVQTWDGLTTHLAENPPGAASKKFLRLFKLAKFGDKKNPNGAGSYRHNGNVLHLSGIIAEHDAGEVSVDEAAKRLETAGVAAFVYTSPSHLQHGKGPRWRVLTPLSDDLPPEKHNELMDKLNGALGGVLAPESWTLTQIFYYGKVDGSQYETRRVKGAPLDLVEGITPIGKKGQLAEQRVERTRDELAPTAHLTELRRLVYAKNADGDYDTWLKVGQAIHHETQGSDDGLALWDEWSAQSGKYPGHDQLAYKWSSFGNAPNPVTAGWLRQGIVATAADLPPPLTDAQLDEIDAAISGKPAAPTLRVRGHSEAKVEEPKFVLAPLIPRRVVTLLAGHGDAGKSYLSLVIAAHVACGADFAKLPVHQTRVLFVSLEDSSDVVWLRLERIADAYGLDLELIKQHVTVVDVNDAGLDADEGLDSVLVTERNDHGMHRLQFTATFDEVCKHAEGHGLVIIDNASDAYDANENERRLVRRFVRRLQRAIAQRHDAAVLLLAHIDKQGAKLGTMGNTYSGSTSWHNTVRSRLALFTDEGDHDQLTLVHEKSNLTRRLDGDIKLVRSGEHGGVPLWLTEQEAEKIATEASSSDDDAVFTAIRRATDAGVNVPAATTGTRTAAHVLRGRPELPAAMVKTKSNALLNAALERLERAGRITRETYKNEHRKEASRFVVSSGAPPPREPTVAELLPPPERSVDSDADLL